MTGPKELFMDPNKLSVDGTISIEQMAFSRDGSMLAYALSEKGSDVHTIRVGLRAFFIAEIEKNNV